MQYCLPAPLKLISEFAEEGIDITQMCGSSKALDIVVETNETSDGCYVYYTRHYTVKSECTDRVFAEIDHKFVLPRTLKLNGYLSTLYYEDEAHAEYEDIGTLLSNGVKIEYSGEDSDLTLSSKDFEMDVPNRIRREYYVSPTCESIADTIIQYLVKVSPAWSEFEVMEVNNVSIGDVADGSIVLRTPQDDQLEEGQTVVVTAGVPVGVSGSTNILKVQTVGKISLGHLKL